jgi:transposase
MIAFYEGVSIKIISSSLFIDQKTVRNYVNKYKDNRELILSPFEKNTIKKSDMKEYKDILFSILHSPPSDFGINRTTWRMVDLYNIINEKGYRISISNIRKIIKKSGFTFRKAKVVLTSNDPEYAIKLKEMTGILSSLKITEKFFSIDEYGPFAIKIHNGRKLTPKGEIRTIPQWQKSKGSLIITAALELSTNQITHFYSTKKNTAEMIKLLLLLIKQYKNESCLYFSWDAASWHASKEFNKMVESFNTEEYRSQNGNPLIKLVPLPSSAQFLNVIESVFSGMARAIIHNSDYNTIENCKAAIDKYFLDRNIHFITNPKKAGEKIWGKELVKPQFAEGNNCKDPKYR